MASIDRVSVRPARAARALAGKDEGARKDALATSQCGRGLGGLAAAAAHVVAARLAA